MSDHWAKEADRLLNDATLKGVLDNMRQEALEKLAAESADDKTQILWWQAHVATIDNIRAELRARILRTETATDGPSPYA